MTIAQANGQISTFDPDTLIPRVREMYSAMASRNSGNPPVGP